MSIHRYESIKTALSPHLSADLADRVLTFLMPYPVPEFNAKLLENMGKIVVNGSIDSIHNKNNTVDKGAPLFYLQHKTINNRLYILGYRKEDTLVSNLRYLEAYNNYINVNRNYFIAQLPNNKDNRYYKTNSNNYTNTEEYNTILKFLDLT